MVNVNYQSGFSADVLLEHCDLRCGAPTRIPSGQFVRLGVTYRRRRIRARLPPSKPIKPATLSCEKFLAVDQVWRPAIVCWSEGVNSNGKAEEGVFDTESMNRLVPVLVEDCQKEPQMPYLKKVKMQLNGVFYQGWCVAIL